MWRIMGIYPSDNLLRNRLSGSAQMNDVEPDYHEATCTLSNGTDAGTAGYSSDHSQVLHCGGSRACAPCTL